MRAPLPFITVFLAALAPIAIAQPQPPTPTAPPKDLAITNDSKTAIVLFPKHAPNDALIDPPSEITLKPGESAHLQVRADWSGSAAVDFLPEAAVRGGYAFPYAAAAFTAAQLHPHITDLSIPHPSDPLKKQPDPAPAAKPLVPYPHPLITEVLYAVPTGAAGDANKDGTRETNGDEFVEIVNPHDRPIDLRGYTLSGKAPENQAPGKKFTILKFTFPACELAPGQVAVIFNGHGAKWTTPVGDTTHAGAPNPYFCNARVFTMNVDSARLGFSNKADCILLTAPGGEKVHCIKWGDVKPPDKVALVETAPEVSGQSVFRRTVDGALEPHPSLEGFKYSPGRFPLDQTVPPAPTTPPPAPPQTTPSPQPPKTHSNSHKH